MPSDYEIAHNKYRELAKKAAAGDPVAKADKAKAMQDIRTIEREAARAGTVLSATYKAEKVVTHSQSVDSKKSLQEEYIRKFDPDVTVNIGGEEQTLRKYHSKRLLGK